jgi:fido (protein-threonine AMPylation protein)
MTTYNEQVTYDLDDIKYDKERKQRYWNIAIGLNKVDGLLPSKYLIDLSNENIDGKLSNTEVDEKLKDYYSKDANTINIMEQECDLVSLRIVELLENKNFIFRLPTFKGIHEYLFKDIYSFAGRFRDYNITKDEPILNHDTVRYADYLMIEETLKYDFDEEQSFDYSKVSLDQLIRHISNFTSRIWQVHPYGEGNTRTTAVFIEKYLVSKGFDITNDTFKEHSVYFRNALVRANYANARMGVFENLDYLVLFFENLLKGKEHILNADSLKVKELFEKQ